MRKLFLIILVLPILSFAQIVKLNVTVNYLDMGEIEYSRLDTTYLEGYWNCGMDNGIRLKEKLPDALYEVYYNDTLEYSTNYLNNQKNGISSNFHSNGQLLSTQNYSNGLTNGKYVEMNINGDTITTYETINGQLEGKWISKNSDGIITYIAIFKKGHKTFTTEYSEKGLKEKTTEYKDGLYDGKKTQFYENGTVKREETYKMDKMMKYISYDRDGNIEAEKEY